MSKLPLLPFPPFRAFYVVTSITCLAIYDIALFELM